MKVIAPSGRSYLVPDEPHVFTPALVGRLESAGFEFLRSPAYEIGRFRAPHIPPATHPTGPARPRSAPLPRPGHARHVPDVRPTSGVLDTSQVLRATGVTTTQIRYWRQIGLVVPSVQASSGHAGVPNLYAPRDVERVRAVVQLLRDGLSLQRIRHLVAGGQVVLP